MNTNMDDINEKRNKLREIFKKNFLDKKNKFKKFTEIDKKFDKKEKDIN
jgi:hypothetical protein